MYKKEILFLIKLSFQKRKLNISAFACVGPTQHFIYGVMRHCRPTLISQKMTHLVSAVFSKHCSIIVNIKLNKTKFTASQVSKMVLSLHLSFLDKIASVAVFLLSETEYCQTWSNVFKASIHFSLHRFRLLKRNSIFQTIIEYGPRFHSFLWLFSSVFPCGGKQLKCTGTIPFGILQF